MVEISVIRDCKGRVRKCHLAFGVRTGETAMLCKAYGLDDSESFHGPVGQIYFRFFDSESVEHLPGGVSEPEERRPVLIHQEAPVRMYTDPAVDRGLAWQGLYGHYQ